MIGIVWAAAWWLFYRAPADHPALGAAERDHILAGRPPVKAGNRAPAREIVKRRGFWGIAIARFLAEPAWQTFSFWVPLYLVTERHMDLKGIALFAWLPFLAADFGSILGGYLSPLLMRWCGLTLVASRVGGRVYRRGDHDRARAVWGSPPHLPSPLPCSASAASPTR